MVTEAIYISQKISVVERERLMTVIEAQGLSVSENSAVKIGQLAGCSYIIVGSATHFSNRQVEKTKSSGLFSLSYKYEKSAEIHTVLESRLIDVATGAVVLSFTCSGSAAGETYSEELERHALSAAASCVADKVRGFLAGEYPVIVSAENNTVRINRGAMSGVSVGTLYRVYEEGAELFDLDGNSLGRRTANLALIRVVDVHDDYSVAEVLNSEQKQPAKNKKRKGRKAKNDSSNESVSVIQLHEGDKIEVISLQEAGKLKLSPQRLH